MADRLRFGPAGVPPYFRLMKAKIGDVPKLLKEEGLDAFEYAAVRWGQQPQIKQEDAQKLGVEAKKNDVQLSVHGSYFINLLGEKTVAEASKQRLIACAKAAEWMGAYVIVFHTGFYGKRVKSESFQLCLETLRDISKTLRDQGLENVKLGPETMGRQSQFGNLDEILEICQQIEETQLVIDWSHIHALTKGGLKTVDDFRRIAEKAEYCLGTEATRNMHCHFSKIEFTEKGERRHHVLEEPGYGPEFENLMEVISEFKLRPVIICETPLQDIDALKMRDAFKKTIKH
jgi:deoxyribonuclease-4